MHTHSLNRGTTHPDPISAQLQIPQYLQPLQPFNLRDLVLHKIQVRQLDQMRDILYMLYLIEAQIQTSQILELIQTLDMRNKVIVEIEFDQRPGDFRRKRDPRYLVLPQTYSLETSPLILTLITNPPLSFTEHRYRTCTLGNRSRCKAGMDPIRQWTRSIS